jgi:hypothetical protein
MNASRVGEGDAMSMHNEIRRQRKTTLEYTCRRLRGEIENLTRSIAFHLDCSLVKAENIEIPVVDAMFDELKGKWGELLVALDEISRIEKELN